MAGITPVKGTHTGYYVAIVLDKRKGVIVDVFPDEDMPIDKFGRRAHIIMDPDSIAKRMNDGCFYETYVHASMDQTEAEVKRMYENGGVDAAYDHLVKYYSCLSIPMRNATDHVCANNPVQKKIHVESVIKEGMHIWMPPGTPKIGIGQVRLLQEHFPLDHGPIQYRTASGELEWTVDDVIIGGMYLILLEKTGNDWAAVGSLKHQHHGVPAKLTQKDRYSQPWREQPNRSLAEAEVRNAMHAVDEQVVADLLEMPNSPDAQKMMARNILEADTPTDLETIIDYSQLRRGFSRALMFVKHILECMGIQFARTKGNGNDR